MLETAPEKAPIVMPLTPLGPEILDYDSSDEEWNWFRDHEHIPKPQALLNPPSPENVLKSSRKAAIFVSDMHMGDGSIADDFCMGRLFPKTILPSGVIHYYGEPRATSLAALFAQTIQTLSNHLMEVSGVSEHDIVLNGDIIDLMEMKNRGSGLWSEHAPFFGVLRHLQQRHDIYYLRGNHDFVVPPGPWKPGEVYENNTLETVAQHGDQWDTVNQPPGLESQGAKIAKANTLGETFPINGAFGLTTYPFAGLDNIRPQNSETISKFIGERVGGSVLNAILIGLGYVINMEADDTGSYRKAKEWRQTPTYRNWLTVAGHTHIPIAKRGVHYNTGTWQPTLVVQTSPWKEIYFHSIPILLVYIEPLTNKRQEEFWTLKINDIGTAKLQRDSSSDVEGVRNAMGYPRDPEFP